MSQSYDAGNSFGVFGGDNLDRPVHGGIKPYELRGLGLNPEEVLDFSASVSPTGQPVGLFEALSRADLSAYPDPSCLELKEVLAQIVCMDARFLEIVLIGIFIRLKLWQ